MAKINESVMVIKALTSLIMKRNRPTDEMVTLPVLFLSWLVPDFS